MSFAPNDDLQRAKDALTVLRLWEFAALPAAVEGRDGKFFSPFREERTPSFSISKEGRVWCDFGGGPDAKGGVWEFAERVWPNASPGEIAAKLIEASGIVPTPRRVEQPAAAGGAAEASPELKRAAAEMERKRRLREAEERPYLEREKWLQRPEIKPAAPWPAAVRERWAEGVKFLLENPKRADAIAADRGWPIGWAAELVRQNLLSFVVERRFDLGDPRGRRQKAFRVDAPVSKGAAAALDPIGYHQRFFLPPKGDLPAQKKWMFLPSVPKFRPQSAYEQALLEYGAQHGSVPPAPAALVPPLPFVLGDLKTTRLIVLLEGQWDAITFYGACGWFYDDDQVEALPEAGVAVFGIRGAQGVDPFLGHWWPWLARVGARCWIIADNDAAGGTWREAPPAERGKIQMPSFADRLKAAGCRDVLVSWLKPGPWGKDFNDYYKASAAAGRAPGPDAMRRWMQREGLLTAAGRFA